jgi:hypothetical protein
MDAWSTGGEISFNRAFAAVALGDPELHWYVSTSLVGANAGGGRRLHQEEGDDGITVSVTVRLPVAMATESTPVANDSDFLASSSFQSMLLAELQSTNDEAFGGVQVLVQSRPCEGSECEPAEPEIPMLAHQAIEYCAANVDAKVYGQLSESLLGWDEEELYQIIDNGNGQIESHRVSDFLESLRIDLPLNIELGVCVVEYMESMACNARGEGSCPPSPQPPTIPDDSMPDRDAIEHTIFGIRHCSMGAFDEDMIQRINTTLHDRVLELEGLIMQEVRNAFLNFVRASITTCLALSFHLPTLDCHEFDQLAGE